MNPSSQSVMTILAIILVLLATLPPATASAEVREVAVPVVIQKPDCGASQQPNLRVLNQRDGEIRYVLRSRAEADHWFLGAERSDPMDISEWDAPIPPARVMIECETRAISAVGASAG